MSGNRQNTQQGDEGLVAAFCESQSSRYKKMKKHGDLFQKFSSFENLYLAYLNARRGKSWQRHVQFVDADAVEKITDLQKSIIDGTYRTSPYKLKWIHEPKTRLIYILPFYPDRIAQHALIQVLGPIWDSLFISDSYACRKGKGQHKASSRCMDFVRRNKWCLQCDIHKFYPSITHSILEEIIRQKIKDRRMLRFIDEIIMSGGDGVNVPIGNYTSQWFGNLYLNEVDRLAKSDLKISCYERYCDDFLLFSDDKAKLQYCAKIVRTFCGERLHLELSKCELFPTSQGVDFVGYRHFPNGKILVRKRTAKKIRASIKSIPWRLKHKLLTKDSARSVVDSAMGVLKHAETYNLRKAMGIEELRAEILDA